MPLPIDSVWLGGTAYHGLSCSSNGDVWALKRILTLYGSGVTGLTALYILKAVMVEVADVEQTAKPPAFSSSFSPLFSAKGRDYEPQSLQVQNYRPCHYFDCISGAGIGGTFAVMLGSMRLTIQETIERSEKIFEGTMCCREPYWRNREFKLLSHHQKRKKINSKTLRRNLEWLLEKDPVGDTDKRTKSRTAGQYRLDTLEVDRNTCQTIVLTMHKAAKGIEESFAFKSYRQNLVTALNSTPETCEVRVVDACLASSASRGSFESVTISRFHGSFRDSSSLEIDPALQTCREMHDFPGYSNGNLQCLLSIGPERIATQLPGQSWQTQSNGGGIFEDPRQSSEMLDVDYDRCGCVLTDLDSSSECDIFKIRKLAEAYIRCIRSEIRELAVLLVNYRRHRARTVQWDRYAGLRITCPFCSKDFQRAALISHVDEQHPPQTKISVQRNTTRRLFDWLSSDSTEPDLRPWTETRDRLGSIT